MNHLVECDWKKELILCNKCLNLDDRNCKLLNIVIKYFNFIIHNIIKCNFFIVHCWNYREFIVQKAGISPEEEFQFATSKILNNFSNYSSWHYRSQLLSKIFHNSNQNSIYEKKKEGNVFIRY